MSAVTRIFRSLCILLALLLLAGCTSSPPLRDSARAKELGDAFISDLPGYVQYKDDLRSLLRTGAAVSTESATYLTDPLEDFIAAYDRGEDASVTIVSAKTAFVVTRVVFEQGAGYYLRYQYDPDFGDSYAVTTKFLDSAALVRYQSTGRLDLELFEGKRQIATISLKNVVKTSSAESLPQGTGASSSGK